MRKAVSSFTTQKRESRCLLSYLSIRQQFVNPQWALCGRIQKNKIPGVPRLPDEFEFEVVFKYRLVTGLHCVHKVQSLSQLWSLLKTEFKQTQTLINNTYANGQKPNQIILSFHSINQQSDITHFMGAGQHVQKKKKKKLRSSLQLFKIFVLQSGSLLSYTSSTYVWVH